ncbi:nucleotidyltransferase domain-containing protein [Microbacterium sp.]|uniref:nucleotidyltransferase domain-containing protein n=1 Tax=Microbacterium sp. TaxID=51671 RepID=UPI003F967C45
MAISASAAATPWEAVSADEVAELLGAASVRWWLSGGAALDRWLGRSIRERSNIDVSVVAGDLATLVANLPEGFSAWAPSGEEDEIVPFADAPSDADLQPVLIRDDAKNAWVLQVNAEDGAPRAWVYKRDPRLTLPWDRAVIDIDGIPTGAPEVQLVWKALRPRPEDTTDKDAVLPQLDAQAVTFYETALLRIHPHSTWAIHVRSPFAPAKSSWNRKKS